MDPMLMDAIETQAEFNRRSQKARMSRGLFMQILKGRPSLQDNPSMARKIAQGTIESFFWVGTQLNWKTGTTYITFSSDANKYALWEVAEGTGGTYGTNQASANFLDVVLWAGIILNYDVQAATLDEICSLGKATIQYGEQGRPNRTIALQELLVQDFYRIFDLDVDTVSEAGAIPIPFKGGFYFDRNEPMVVVPQDSRPAIEIKGLSSTIAGSTPILKGQLAVRGIRVRL